MRALPLRLFAAFAAAAMLWIPTLSSPAGAAPVLLSTLA